ncbi:MAG: TrkH family potassium uptake protein [Clostridiales bacterium]|nr:TrkH family potassium uptake protein [Clostridiales bacterium]
MNIKMVFSILGRTLLIEAGLLLLPLLVGIIYGDNTWASFLIPIGGLIAIGLPLSLLKLKDRSIHVKEGFVTVAFVWILMSLFGALPFVISGAIPSYIDALFETVSGFTTTGASIMDGVNTVSVDDLSHSLQFWRLSTHWIGGMGVLVFVLAILPGYNSGIMHVFRAESPGPSVGKLVSKLTRTARILYGIYIIMTAIEAIMLICGGMSVYEGVVHAFSTAGTGGFGIKGDSIASYSTYHQMVIAVFMFLFGINFNLYYLILIRHFKKAIKSEEFIVYLVMVVGATLAIALNILSLCANFGDALRLSFFQVASFSSSTGFTTAEYNKWPALSQAILVLLMIVGACGGSTGGGIKVSRAIILVKSGVSDIRRMLHPRSVVSTKVEGEILSKETERNVHTYFILWVVIVIVCTILLSIDCNDVLTNFTATLSCIGNMGPIISLRDYAGNFAFYSPYCKLLLSFVMLVGRLEIFPMILMFAPRTWKRGS